MAVGGIFYKRKPLWLPVPIAVFTQNLTPSRYKKRSDLSRLGVPVDHGRQFSFLDLLGEDEEEDGEHEVVELKLEQLTIGMRSTTDRLHEDVLFAGHLSASYCPPGSWHPAVSLLLPSPRVKCPSEL